MGKFALKTFLLVLCALFTFAAHAGDEPRTVDATQLDIAGIRLGMPVEQAIGLAIQYLKIEKNSIDIREADGKAIGVFIARNNISRLEVITRVQEPGNPKSPTQVISIKESVAYKSERSFEENTLGKYGAPSVTQNRDKQWCLHPSPQADGCPLSEPLLAYVPGRLTLRDFSQFEGYAAN